LRQRREDVLPLARYFLDNLAQFYDEPAKKLSSHAEQLLLNYVWPGNVRQLANAMERAYVLSQNEVIEPSALPAEILMSAYAAGPGRVLPTLDAAQEQLITEALRVTSGQKKSPLPEFSELIDAVSIESSKSSISRFTGQAITHVAPQRIFSIFAAVLILSHLINETQISPRICSAGRSRAV